MVFSIYAQNNEFAASTGSNVNSGAGTSTFDYPPTSSKDLVITTKAGDDDPRLFEVGDVYEISFGGNGGATLLNATVIRSDMAPGGGGAIVFEGFDTGGALTQVVWTPDFDLENWYFSNFSGGQSPGFYTTDQNASYSHTYVCFAAGTRIATPDGPRAVERLVVGDAVLTMDHGAQPIVWCGARVVSGAGRNAPILFERGSRGNAAAVFLSQHHRVLHVSPLAELLFGAHEVLAPARAFVNGRNIRPRPRAQITYVHLLFARHEIIFAEGMPCESLFLGDQVDEILGGKDSRQIGILRDQGKPIIRAARPILTMREALCVVKAPSMAMTATVPHHL